MTRETSSRISVGYSIIGQQEIPVYFILTMTETAHIARRAMPNTCKNCKFYIPEYSTGSHVYKNRCAASVQTRTNYVTGEVTETDPEPCYTLNPDGKCRAYRKDKRDAIL